MVSSSIKIKANDIFLKKEHSNKTLFIVGAVIGICVFVYIYGIDVLNVKNEAWIFDGGDMAQHYIGWKFFRNSEWNVLFGLSNNVIYPGKMSVIYTDSIPILAVFFKILSPILPSTFQYFGMWGLLCYVLQGGIASVIIRKYTRNIIIFSSAVLFFVVSPIFTERMFVHTSLASHWVLLLGIVPWIYSDFFKNNHNKNILFWLFLSVISVGIHPYLYAMNFIFMTGFQLYLVFEEKFSKKQILEFMKLFLIVITVSAILMYFLGFFYGNRESSNEGLGFFSANLNSLINSMDKSFFLKSLSFYSVGQFEGFAYLGSGAIFLFLSLVYIDLRSMLLNYKTVFKKKEKLKKTEKSLTVFIQRNSYKISIILVVLVSMWLALSPTVTWGTNLLLEIKYPLIIENALTVFRASGRFMWPVFYLIIVATICLFLKKNWKQSTAFLLLIFSIIQIVDIAPIIAVKKGALNSNQLKYNYVETIEDWEHATAGKKHIVFMSKSLFSQEYVFDIGNFAADHDMIINNFYIARESREESTRQSIMLEKELLQNGSSNDSIYVFDDIFDIWQLQYDLVYYKVDSIILGVKTEIIELAKNKITPTNNIELNTEDFIFYTEGYTNEGQTIIASGGIQFGPYIDVLSGKYRVIYKGSNLENVGMSIGFKYSKVLGLPELIIISNENEEFIVEFRSKLNLYDLEFVLFNSDDEVVIIDSIELIYLGNE